MDKDRQTDRRCGEQPTKTLSKTLALYTTLYMAKACLENRGSSRLGGSSSVSVSVLGGSTSLAHARITNNIERR